MVLEKTWVPWTARSNQSIRKSVLNVHWKDWCWSWSSSALATWYEEPTHWKRPWCWERCRRRRGKQDEMVGWHHRLNGHGFEQALGDSEGQGILVCCSQWGGKELDTTEQLNKKCWRGCEKKGSLLYCWWDCKLIQPLWKTVRRVLKKLEIKLPYNPTIPLLCISP